MESSLPFALRVAAGLVSETLSVVRRLPTEVSTLPVTVIGRVAKYSFQLNQQLTELAMSGDHLLASLHTEPAPPERTAWSTIDDDSSTAETATTWDHTPEEPLPDGVISTNEPLGHPLVDEEAAEAIARTHLSAVPTPVAAREVSALTIAQLRSRVRTMTAEQVRDALEQEQAGKKRPAFLTVLTNRLATVARDGE